jgi:hypothetical protein
MSQHDPVTAALPLTEPQLAAITTACRQNQVQRMHVFGSALRADFDPNRSDLDLLVEFKAIDSTQLVRAYFDLERQLLEITGKPVDLVMADAIHNRYVRADIEATKHLIYEAGPRPGIPGPIRPMSLMRAKPFKTLWPKSISTITAVAA